MSALPSLALAVLTATATAGPGLGRVKGIVFEAGSDRPLPGLDVRIDGAVVARTDTEGAFRLDRVPGVLRLELSGVGFARARTASIAVVAGEVAELLLTIDPRGRVVSAELELASPELAAPAQLQADRPLGVLDGLVVDAETGRPVEGARIFVRARPEEGRTDAEGRFRLRLPVGRADLTVVHARYAARTERGVELEADAITDLRLALTPAALELDAFTVSAPRVEGSMRAVLEERRESAAVAEVLGAEQMARAGDSSAAGALQRVTGVTVVGGRYVYVRGLGERYSQTLLDGAGIPSPDPERRVVPLDLFPTDQLESVRIRKTFSPDMPGEFGGGSVELRTRPAPRQRIGSLGVSTGVRLGTSFTRGPVAADSGPLDVLGFDAGHRALPAEVRAASERAPLLERDQFSSRGYSAAELERFGEAISGGWGIEQRTLGPDVGAEGSFGDAFRAFGGEGGYLLSLNWSRSLRRVRRRENILTVGQAGALELAHRYDFDEVTAGTQLGGLGTLGLELEGGHRLKLTALVDHVTDDESRVYEGPNRDVDAEIRISRLWWIERLLTSQQLSGHHPLSDSGATLDWRYGFAVAGRSEPDRRSVRYDREPGTGEWFLSDRPEGNRRVVSGLTHTSHDLGLDLGLPFALGKERSVRVSLGARALRTDRDVDTRRYRFLHKGPQSRDPAVLSAAPGEVFVPANIGADGFQLEEVTLPTDNYGADQTVLAGYAMLDAELGRGWRVVGGVRAEYGRQAVETFKPFAPELESIRAELADLDLLPALSVAWSFEEDMVLRLAASRTVSRPDFRELSPATFNDVTGGRLLFGNPELERARITHADLRWDWLGDDELLSVSAFFKSFDAPIEIVVVPSAQLSVTFANAVAARNLGLEVELRRGLGVLGTWARDLYVSGNAAAIWSRVELPEGSTIQTSRSRPLQGQSPWIANLQLGWDDVDHGRSATVVYNVFGPRIAEVGALGAPDVYEQPVHRLDLVYRHGLGDGWSLSARASNLIDAPIRRTQGAELVSSYRAGRQLGVGLGRSF